MTGIQIACCKAYQMIIIFKATSSRDSDTKTRSYLCLPFMQVSNAKFPQSNHATRKQDMLGSHCMASIKLVLTEVIVEAFHSSYNLPKTLPFRKFTVLFARKRLYFSHYSLKDDLYSCSHELYVTGRVSLMNSISKVEVAGCC